MRTAIEHTTVISVDASDTVHQDATLIFDQDKIVHVGDTQALKSEIASAQQVIDGRNHVLLPGFISAHNHLGYAVFRGRAEDLGYDATQRLYLPMSSVISREERQAIGALAIAELLRGGVTTVLEMEEDADLFAAFIDDVGLRAGIGIMLNDLNLDELAAGRTVFDEHERDRRLEQAVRLVEQWHGRGEGRLQGYLALTGLSSSSPSLMKAVREQADLFGVRVSSHLGFGEGELVKRVHGMEQLDYAREHGLLGDELVAVHCYQLDDDEVQTLAASGSHLAHCPLMNQFRGEIAAIGDLRAEGMNVALGIDNYFSDYFELLRACIASARIRAQRPDILSAAEVLRLATVNAALALGIADEVGSLEAGKQADLQMVDMRRYGLTPTNNPVQTLVYHAHAKDVDKVFVAGRQVVDDGVVQGVDELALIDAAGQSADDAWQRFADQHGGYAANAPSTF